MKPHKAMKFTVTQTAIYIASVSSCGHSIIRCSSLGARGNTLPHRGVDSQTSGFVRATAHSAYTKSGCADLCGSKTNKARLRVLCWFTSLAEIMRNLRSQNPSSPGSRMRPYTRGAHCGSRCSTHAPTNPQSTEASEYRQSVASRHLRC